MWANDRRVLAGMLYIGLGYPVGAIVSIEYLDIGYNLLIVWKLYLATRVYQASPTPFPGCRYFSGLVISTKLNTDTFLYVAISV